MEFTALLSRGHAGVQHLQASRPPVAHDGRVEGVMQDHAAAGAGAPGHDRAFDAVVGILPPAVKDVAVSQQSKDKVTAVEPLKQVVVRLDPVGQRDDVERDVRPRDACALVGDFDGILQVVGIAEKSAAP